MLVSHRWCKGTFKYFDLTGGEVPLRQPDTVKVVGFGTVCGGQHRIKRFPLCLALPVVAIHHPSDIHSVLSLPRALCSARVLSESLLDGGVCARCLGDVVVSLRREVHGVLM